MHVLGVELQRPTVLSVALSLGLGAVGGIALLLAGAVVAVEVAAVSVILFSLGCAWGSVSASMGASLTSPGGRRWQKLVITVVPAAAIGLVALMLVDALN